MNEIEFRKGDEVFGHLWDKKARVKTVMFCWIVGFAKTNKYKLIDKKGKIYYCTRVVSVEDLP